jgi:sarcosine oxidase
MGSAATYHLARRGHDVLGLERFDVPHAKGSSHGVTRIVRRTAYEDPAHLPLLDRAYELWHDLDAAATVDLIHPTGYVAAGPEEGTLFPKAVEACRTHDLEHEVVSGAQLSREYPGYDLPAGYGAVVQPDGGFLHAEQCIVAHVERAHRHGAEIRAREAVSGWSTAGSRVEVTTDEGTYVADRLVVTAGAWASRLVPDLERVAVPERQVLGWFQPSRREAFLPETFPACSVECPEGHFYATPVYHVPGVKLGKHHHLREPVDPDAVAAPSGADEELLRGFAERYLSGAAGPTMGLSSCLYTNSPDGQFILDVLADDPRVAVAAGFSGHGFKFASVVGEILADLAVHGETDHPIDEFGLDRLETDADGGE